MLDQFGCLFVRPVPQLPEAPLVARYDPSPGTPTGDAARAKCLRKAQQWIHAHDQRPATRARYDTTGASLC
jgi:hypothetical protein